MPAAAVVLCRSFFVVVPAFCVFPVAWHFASSQTLLIGRSRVPCASVASPTPSFNWRGCHPLLYTFLSTPAILLTFSAAVRPRSVDISVAWCMATSFTSDRCSLVRHSEPVPRIWHPPISSCCALPPRSINRAQWIDSLRCRSPVAEASLRSKAHTHLLS